MKIAKALKQKNKLAGEVAKLKVVLGEQNSKPKGQDFAYNNDEVWAGLRQRTEDLVQTKAAIARANSKVYDKIFRLAELKGLVQTLQGLDTKEGNFIESLDFSSTVEVKYRAQFSLVKTGKLIEELEEQIQSLQDKLDEFNFTETVSV